MRDVQREQNMLLRVCLENALRCMSEYLVDHAGCGGWRTEECADVWTAGHDALMTTAANAQKGNEP